MTITPYTYDSVEDIDPDRMPFPVLDNPFALNDGIERSREVDANWELTGVEWFVDLSGFGHPGEPALVIDAFVKVLTAYVADNPGHGFVITGVGQFQVFVAAYRPK